MMNKRRKGALAVVFPWVRRFGLYSMAAFVCMWIGVFLFVSGGLSDLKTYAGGQAIAMTAAMGFVVEDVLVEGRKYSDVDVIKNIISADKGAPLFAFDPQKIRTALEQTQWVKRAGVERRFPGTLYITLEEHSPLALWQKDKTLRLLDEAGNIIDTDRLSRFGDLLIVMGDGAPAAAPALIGNLKAEPDLARHIASARWMDGRRWDLLLKDDVTVMLPESDIGLALRQLAEAQDKDKILDKDISVVDLREQGRLILRTKPGAVQEYKAQQAALKIGDPI